ncbi:MAG: TIGR02147 family protein [Myxococcales bacterium]|nr:TIGR02147 family protein [Myxococcales bacterium]
MARRRAVIDVFRYLDYRVFLADHYRARKARGFSYRRFSSAAGVSSPSYLKLVIEGQRNLTAAMAERFATACRLEGDAASYFQELVRFNQATDDQERSETYRRLSGFQRYRRAQKLELAHAAYHANWFMPAIRELVASPDFREDPAWIGKRLSPAVPARQVARALKILLDLGLLTRNDHGRLTQASAVVSTGGQTASLHIGNYHRGMLERASEAIELAPKERRDISSLTLRVRESAIGELKQRLARFRRELLDFEEGEVDGDQVVQVNLQLFPLTAARHEHEPSEPRADARHDGGER